jgi:hypothetical protein
MSVALYCDQREAAASDKKKKSWRLQVMKIKADDPALRRSLRVRALQHYSSRVHRPAENHLEASGFVVMLISTRSPSQAQRCCRLCENRRTPLRQQCLPRPADADRAGRLEDAYPARVLAVRGLRIRSATAVLQTTARKNSIPIDTL